MALALKQKQKIRKFKDDFEVQTVVTKCLLIEEIDILNRE
jgi:hypothetical protein